MFLSDTGRNIDFAIEGTTCKVISTVDGTLHQLVSASWVTDQIGVFTLGQVVHVGLVNIARLIGTTTVCTTKNAADLDGRAEWHIHNSATGDPLFVTTTIGCTYLSAHQVDNSRGFVKIKGGFTFHECVSCRIAHTQTVIGTCSEHLGIGEIINIVGNIDQHVAVILSLVTVTVTRIALSGTENLIYSIVDIRVWSEIDKGIVQIRLFSHATISSRSYLICWIVIIIIVTEATAKDVSHPTLRVLHIGRGLLDLCLIGFSHHVADSRTDAATEIGISKNTATQVVSAIDMVTDPWEPATVLVGSVGFLLTTYIRLCMSEDIGITTTCKRVENTAITKVDMGITGNHTFESTTVDELTFSHVRTVARSSSCHTREAGFTVQVDVSTVCRIIYIFSSFIKFSIFLLAADGTHLTTTEDLEHITLIQVDGGTTPYL